MLLSSFWAARSTEMFVLFRTDLRQVVMCGVYFWVGVVFCRYNISRFFSTTNVLVAMVVWVSLTRWLEIFVMASWVILPFLALAFGLTANTWLSRLSNLDYSYGIYIYAFPIQQALVGFYPKMPLLLYLLLSTVCTLSLAALSWHWIEKPALRLKPRASRVAA